MMNIAKFIIHRSYFLHHLPKAALTFASSASPFRFFAKMRPSLSIKIVVGIERTP